MGYRIAPVAAPKPQKARPVKSKDYLAWLHSLPCVVSGRRPVEAAHVSYEAREYGALGRGKQQKSSDRWALPLHPEEHRIQHSMMEREYWRICGIDPHQIACILWGLYHERDALEATELAEDAIAALPRTGGLARQYQEG